MAKKRTPKHAMGNNAWLDAAKRTVRATVPAIARVTRSEAYGLVEDTAKAVLEQIAQ
ncbi:hypothetical protein [Streptomyces sp. NPDC058548]|uniref:hypothetical protein n=1 Tax=Streptomyces sp. NPDC058548 TaxID=3346545 RepID=UPI003666D4B7